MPTINSFTVKPSGTRWVASGSCVFGPIDCSGATEQEAKALAVLQIKAYQKAARPSVDRRVDEVLAMFRKPSYFQGQRV